MHHLPTYWFSKMGWLTRRESNMAEKYFIDGWCSQEQSSIQRGCPFPLLLLEGKHHWYSLVTSLPKGSMYAAATYGNIYHQYTPNVSIYTIHGSYGLYQYKTSVFRYANGISHHCSQWASAKCCGCCGSASRGPEMRRLGLVVEPPLCRSKTSVPSGNCAAKIVIYFVDLTMMMIFRTC